MFYRFLNGYIAVSEERKNRIIEELGLSEEHITVIHWGINSELVGNAIDKTGVREKLGLPDNPIILSLGHLGPIKGHDESIRALSLIKKDFRNAKLYIGGDGSEADSERLHTLIEELKLQDSVILLGQITNSLEWMKACDIFLQPSREEAFGLVFLEAGLCKKPTVATRVGGIPEIIVDGVTGFLVKPFRPDQIAEKLSALLCSHELMETMGNAARLRVEQEFNLGQQVDKLEQLFAKLVQCPRASV